MTQPLDYDTMYKLYVVEQKSDKEIGILYNLKRHQIQHIRKTKMGITKEMKDRYLYDNLKPTQIEDDILIASKLGDGTFKKSLGSANFVFQISHGEKQIDYLQFKLDGLKRFCKDGFKLQIHRNNRFPERDKMYTMWTKSLQLFDDYVSLSDCDLIEKMSINSFLLWYCDDGNFRTPCNANITCARFTPEEIQRVIDTIYTRFNIRGRIVSSKREKYGHQGIKFSQEESRKLFSLFQKSEMYDDLKNILSYKFPV